MKLAIIMRLALGSPRSGSNACPMDGKMPLLASDGSKVLKGYVAVYVGPHMRRFVIPISFLGMPEFRVLLERVEEEFGCDHHGAGALEIPCDDEDHFEEILATCFARHRMASSSNNSNKLLAMLSS
ncbi:hypothetical protein PIB30_012670 [Stylosanthes scabra]|uniref:Small auxin up regulated protein n=1 Tax=Stylosanthes scabra TaxID=79078 RepID=A0ABU6Q604_9FABA|nr:hypothetical protein [Stylosanthes scabra]